MSKEEVPFRRSRGAETVDSCRDRPTERSEVTIEAECRLKVEKLRQDHIIAIKAKEDELRSKDHLVAELKTKIADIESAKSSLTVENDQLKIENKVLGEGKTELQREVFHLNEAVNACGPLQRDYEAALDTIARLRAENEVLRLSRENCHDQTRHYQEQVAELTHHLNHERDKKQTFQESILNLGVEIEKLKEEIDDWKHKYEIEFSKKVENDELAEKRKLKYAVVENRRDNAEAGHLSGREESFRRQSNMVNVNRGKRQNPEDYYRQPENDPGISVGTHENQPQPRKKRFELVPCSVPRCKNCDTVFLNEDLMTTECRFHRAPPQNYQVWTKVNNQDTVRVNPILKGHMFWPCCGTHGRSRPKGCMVLKHHEVVYADE